MMREMSLPIALLIVAGSVFLIGCGSDNPANLNSNRTSQGAVTPLPTATVDEVASGGKVFETNCVICHKTDGSGGKVTIEGKSLDVEDLRSNKIKAFTDEKILGYIVKGVPDEGMPAFKDKLSEGEMRDAVLYIRKEFHGR